MIANSDYSKNPEYSSLEHAEKNAALVKATLNKKGYEVKTEKNWEKPQDALKLFMQMLRMITRKEQIMTFAIFIYYIGHTKVIDGDTHLILNNEDDAKFNIDEALRKQARQD